MADHLTEEEQIEAIKRWWSDNWLFIVVPVVLAAGVYLGNSFWQNKKAADAQLGAAKFTTLTELLDTAPGAQLSEQQTAQAKVLAAEMVETLDGSLYADHANLILARLAVEEDDADAAASYLQRVVDSGANTAIRDLAKSRLARVHISREDFEGALALVGVAGDSEYAALFAEIRGDALAAQGKVDLTKTAYEESIDMLPPEQFNRRSIIQMKIDGVDILAGKVAFDEVPAEASAAEEDNAEGGEDETEAGREEGNS